MPASASVSLSAFAISGPGVPSTSGRPASTTKRSQRSVAAPMSKASEKAAMISARNQGQSCPGVGQNWSGSIDADGMARFLRSIYPQKTAMHVAADTGLPVESIKNWLNGVSAPGFRATVTLALNYGPEFLASMVKEKPRWLDRAAREHRQQELERKLESIKAELASL